LLNELSEEALTSMHSGVDLVRPEVILEGERIAHEISAHQGEKVGAKVFKATGYGVASLAAYTAGEALTKKKQL
jgi:hypothetical protein